MGFFLISCDIWSGGFNQFKNDQWWIVSGAKEAEPTLVGVAHRTVILTKQNGSAKLQKPHLLELVIWPVIISTKFIFHLYKISKKIGAERRLKTPPWGCCGGDVIGSS